MHLLCGWEAQSRKGAKPQERLCRPVLLSQPADLSACPRPAVPCEGQSPGEARLALSSACLAALLAFEEGSLGSDFLLQVRFRPLCLSLWT